MSDDIAPEPYRTEIAKYLHRSFHDEHGPSFWEGYTGHADDLWRIANPTLSTTNPPPPADDLVERLRARLCACPGDDEMIAAVDTILSLRQKLEETEASWEKSRDLVTEQYRQVANALTLAQSQRDALAETLAAARDWIVKTEVDEAYDLEGQDIQNDLLERIDTCLASARAQAVGAREWMAKGYLDGWKGRGPYAPPNHPVARAAYDHGWRSAEADDGKPRAATVAETRARAEAIIAADNEDTPDAP